MSRSGFLESIKCDDATIAKTIEVSRNFTPTSGTVDSGGGRELGDDGPGSLGREPNYKGGSSMGLLDTLKDKTSEVKEQGDAVVETGEEKLEEADAFKGALDGLDALDEDAQEIIDTATEGAQEVATEQAESAISTPMESVNEGLSEVTEEAGEYAEVEHGNAEGVSDAPGDYGSVASQAESSFEQHASEFEESGESAQEINDEFRDRADDMVSRLESIF